MRTISHSDKRRNKMEIVKIASYLTGGLVLLIALITWFITSMDKDKITKAMLIMILTIWLMFYFLVFMFLSGFGTP